MKQRGKRKQRIERSEDNLRDLWDNVNCPNIRIIGVPEDEDKKKGHENILEEIIVENFPKMGKERNLESFFHPSPRNPESPK